MQIDSDARLTIRYEVPADPGFSPGAYLLFSCILLSGALLLPVSVDYCIFNMSHSSIPLGIVLGAAAAGVSLLTIWSALGPETPLRRWPMCVLLACCCHASFAVGTEFGLVSNSTRILQMTPLVPLVFIAGQAPLWLFRGLGFRLRVDRRVTAKPQFTLSFLLLLTMAAAVVVGLARLGMHWLGTSLEDWLVWLPLVCLAGFGGGLLVALPCLLLAMLPDRSFVSIYALVYILIGLGGVCIGLVITRGGLPWGAVTLTIALLATLTTVHSATLLAGRHFGLELVRDNPMSRPAPSGRPSGLEQVATERNPS